MKIRNILKNLDDYFDKKLAEDFDNPGLLIGNTNNELTGVVVTLDITNNCIDFAKKNKCNLIISHHPMIFSSIKKIDINSVVGEKISKIIKNDICIYAIHTNYDCHYDGMNKAVNKILSKKLDFDVIDHIEKVDYDKDKNNSYGFGSYIKLKKYTNIKNLSNIINHLFKIKNIRTYSSQLNKKIKNIAICPGSGKSFVDEIINQKVDCFISGDLSHNNILDLLDKNIAYIDATHSGLENAFIDDMSKYINKNFNLRKVLKYENQNINK